MNRTILISLGIITMLGACGHGQGRIDPEEYFKNLEKEVGAPEVDGLDATRLKAAEKAEEMQDYTRAAQIYQQLVDANNKSPNYLVKLAEVNRKGGQLEMAINAYDAALVLKPDMVEAIEGKGLALLDMGEFQEAGNRFAEVMQQDKTRWRTLNGLAILFVVKGMYEEALAYYTEALVNAPNNPSVMNNVGLTLAIQDRTEDAIEGLVKAAALATSNKALMRKIELNLAMVLGMSGDLDAAKRTAGKHLAGPALSNNMGFYAHLAEDDVLAKSYLNMALTGSSRHYERAWQNLNRLEKQENAASNKGKRGKRIVVK